MWLCTGGPAEPEERVGAGAAVPLLPVLLSGLPPAGQTAPVQHLRHQVPHVQHAGEPPLPPRCRRLVHIFPAISLIRIQELTKICYGSGSR